MPATLSRAAYAAMFGIEASLLVPCLTKQEYDDCQLSGDHLTSGVKSHNYGDDGDE